MSQIAEDSLQRKLSSFTVEFLGSTAISVVIPSPFFHFISLKSFASRTRKTISLCSSIFRKSLKVPRVSEHELFGFQIGNT